MEFRPGKGVLKREKFPNTRKPSHCRICAELWKHRGQHNREKKINKQLKLADCSPTVTPPAEKHPLGMQTPASAISKRGLDREVWRGCIARIWPEYPDHYLSEIIWASKPDCGISTTRKVSPNLRHCQARARNKGLNRDSRLQTFPLR